MEENEAVETGEKTRRYRKGRKNEEAYRRERRRREEEKRKKSDRKGEKEVF